MFRFFRREPSAPAAPAVKIIDEAPAPRQTAGGLASRDRPRRRVEARPTTATGRALLAWRHDAGVTQERAAAALGIGRDRYRRLEYGTSAATASEREAIRRMVRAPEAPATTPASAPVPALSPAPLPLPVANLDRIGDAPAGFAGHVAEAMHATGLAAERYAARIAVSAPTLRKVLRADPSVSEDTHRKVAAAIGLPWPRAQELLLADRARPEPYAPDAAQAAPAGLTDDQAAAIVEIHRRQVPLATIARALGLPKDELTRRVRAVVGAIEPVAS